MSFPETRLTLVRRLASGGDQQDWRTFHDDYWGAICRFATRWRGLSVQDAEDVAAETFQVILTEGLLTRWQEHRTAKLRTLICSVARNIMSNRARVAGGRQQILQRLAAEGSLPVSLRRDDDSSAEQQDVFYTAWVDDLLQRSVDALLATLHQEGKGDYFRVLYGRICENLTAHETAELLQVSTVTAENYFKSAKQRLGDELQTSVRRHVRHYCDDADMTAEFAVEWNRLSDYLSQHGGLENVLRKHYENFKNTGQTSRTFRRFHDSQAAFQ